MPSKKRGDWAAYSRIQASIICVDMGGFKVEDALKKGKSKLKYSGEDLVEEWKVYGNLFITKVGILYFI